MHKRNLLGLIWSRIGFASSDSDSDLMLVRYIPIGMINTLPYILTFMEWVCDLRREPVGWRGKFLVGPNLPLHPLPEELADVDETPEIERIVPMKIALILKNTCIHETWFEYRYSSAEECIKI